MIKIVQVGKKNTPPSANKRFNDDQEQDQENSKRSSQVKLSKEEKDNYLSPDDGLPNKHIPNYGIFDKS